MPAASDAGDRARVRALNKVGLERSGVSLASREALGASDDFERFQSTVEGNTSEREGFTYVLARRPNTGDTYRRSPYGDASAQQAPRRPAR